MPRFWDQWKRKAKLALREKELATLRREHEIDLIKSLPEAEFDVCRPTGVLLSDEIERYAADYKLIDPFNPNKLKPAAYELSVGSLYSISGRTHELTDSAARNEIVINPFEVVILQTLERLNLPAFLIARWNVRVRWAYQGLLWVGAAQVDPGFKGYLACPLYNLSDRPVRLHYGEEIAVIDFVTTTPPNDKSKQHKYDPVKRSRVLFEDYEPNKLRSALATQAQEKIQVFEQRINDLQSTVNTSIGVILAAIGILVAALALFVGKEIPETIARLSPSMIVATLALILALAACVRTPKGSRFWAVSRLVVAALLIGIVIWAYSTVSTLPRAPAPPPTQTHGHN